MQMAADEPVLDTAAGGHIVTACSYTSVQYVSAESLLRDDLAHTADKQLHDLSAESTKWKMFFLGG